MEKQKWLGWLLHSEFHCVGWASPSLSWVLVMINDGPQACTCILIWLRERNNCKERAVWLSWLLYWFLATLVDHPLKNAIRYYKKQKQFLWIDGITIHILQICAIFNYNHSLHFLCYIIVFFESATFVNCEL